MEVRKNIWLMSKKNGLIVAFVFKAEIAYIESTTTLLIPMSKLLAISI